MFSCEICNHVTNNKYSYNKHMNSIKHNRNTAVLQKNIKHTQCEKCFTPFNISNADYL